MRPRAALALFSAALVALATTGASATPPDVEEVADGDFLVDPPAQEGPPLKTPRLRTQLYTDFTYVNLPNLDSLILVKGHGQILRFGLGGSLRLRDVELQLNIPFTDVTTVHLSETPRGGGRPIDQTVAGFGDVRVGAVWRTSLPYYPPKMSIGASLTGLISTHTTKFTVDVPGGQDKYVPPHYWQVEPAGLFATAFGPLSFVTNQGVLALIGQDVHYSDSGIGLTQVFPEMYFWDAHWSGAMYFAERLAVSLDVQTIVQLNTVVSPAPPSPQFDSVLNDIKAVYLQPGIQIYLGSFKLDVTGRLGLGSSADTFGVATLTGKNAAMLRLTRSFDYDAMGDGGGGAAASTPAPVSPAPDAGGSAP